MTHCMICFAETPDRISRTLCCSGVICLSCLEAHIVSKINEAIVAIICPLGNCDSLVSEEEIRQLVPDEVFEKYERFKVEVEQNPGIKICPGCSRIYQHPDLEKVEREKVSRPEVMKVTCSKCRLVWCFACQAPWHHALTCNEFCKGDKSLKIWAKNRGQPARNACRCPKCHVFIQKSSGCDHMCCSRCNTEFCYRCGGKYHDLKFLGNHYDRFSILGCKYNYKPNQPAQRIAVRGALFSGKVVLAPVVASLAVSAGCVVLGAGLVAAPFYAPYVLIKRQRAKHKQKKLRNRKTVENSSL